MLPNRSKIAEVKSGRARPTLTFISLVIYITHSCTVSVFNSVIVKILRCNYHSLSSVFPQKLTNLTVISFKSSSTQAAVSLACKTGLAGCIVFATVIDTFVLEKKDTWSKMHSLTAAWLPQLGECGPGRWAGGRVFRPRHGQTLRVIN